MRRGRRYKTFCCPCKLCKLRNDYFNKNIGLKTAFIYFSAAVCAVVSVSLLLIFRLKTACIYLFIFCSGICGDISITLTFTELMKLGFKVEL